MRTVGSIQTSQGRKLYAICLVKDEDDIIGQTLTFATQYCDKIFVIDNGSTDTTWEIVNNLAGKHPQIVPFVQTLQPYDDGLRWLAYDAHHRELTDSDWWLILDGDELLAEGPRSAIQRAMQEGADIIKAWQIQFYYTQKDHEAWLAGEDSRELPIFERRRHYRIDWQEPRLFRNQSESGVVFRQSKISPAKYTWGASVLSRKGNVSRQRIFNRHYQYRDPPQIEKRLKLRYGLPQFAAQVKSPDWRSVIRSSKDLNYYRDGEAWRFSISGLVHAYRGRLRYAVRSRFLRARRWLTGVLAAHSHKIS